MIDIFPKGAKIPNNPRVKFGIDPTAPSLHLGHMVPLRMVKKMALEGAEVTIVLGDFTAMMGDPSGQDKTRPILTASNAASNAVSICAQVTSFMGDAKWSAFYNGSTFNKMSANDLMVLCSKFTTSRLLSRDGFQKRISEEKPVHLHELMVPLCQAYDSVTLATQVEIGGEDQLFNFQLTRELQALICHTPEICIMTPIINGVDGRKMSKSLNNCIFFSDLPEDIFGRCMSVSDQTMEEWIPLLTDQDTWVDADEHPMLRKKAMALSITAQICDMERAVEAQRYFKDVVQNKEKPKELKQITALTLIGAIMKMRNCSRTQAKKLIGDSVTVDGNRMSFDAVLQSGMIIKVGKHDFAEVKVP